MSHLIGFDEDDRDCADCNLPEYARCVDCCKDWEDEEDE